MDNINIILSNITNLSRKDYHSLIKQYTKELVDTYLNKQIEEELLKCDNSLEKIKVWDKYSYYLSTKEHSVYEKVELKNIANNKKSNFSKKDRLIYGLHLLSKHNLIILKDPSNENTLDIEKILASIKTIETRNYVINKLIDFYNNKINTSIYDKSIKDKLTNYINLCKNNPLPIIKYKFELIEEEYLIEQIDMYIRYYIAKEKYLNNNLNLIKFIIINELKITNNYEDLMNEGVIALKKAINEFDIRKGYTFSTYASVIVSREIIINQRFYEYGMIIPAPNYFYHFKIINKKEELTSILKRTPTSNELASFLGITEKQLFKELLIIKRATCFSLDSINTRIEDKEPVTLENMVIDEKSNFENELVNTYFIKDVLSKLDDILTKKEKEILLKRIGYNKDNEVLTLSSIGKEMGISYESVRKIEQKALKKIRTRYFSRK